jgi:aryl-alcohol dehydrogenase-like predicted oxidoreductase
MKLVLGTAQFGLDYGINSTYGQVNSYEIKKILNFASLKHIDILDTAPAYGNCEKILGKKNISSFKVITKTRHFNCIEINNHHVDLLYNDFNNSLKLLKQDSFYGVLIHNADDLLKQGSKKLFDKLKEFKHKKMVSKIGASVYNHQQLQYIIDNYDIDLVQIPFNILDRRMLDNGMLNKLKKKNINVHARSIFLQGLLLMSRERMPVKFKRWHALWKIWYEWLNDNKMTPLEATLRYAVSFPGINKVLVGVDTKDQLEKIIESYYGALPEIPSELYTNDVNLLNPSNWGKL